jgi:UDP-glucuronate 4-epimerase
MIETLEKAIDKKAKRKYMDMQPGDVERTHADITKSKSLLNYNPLIDFETGIRKFVDWKLFLKI